MGCYHISGGSPWEQPEDSLGKNGHGMLQDTAGHEWLYRQEHEWLGLQSFQEIRNLRTLC